MDNNPSERQKISREPYDYSSAFERSSQVASSRIPQTLKDRSAAPERLSELLAAAPSERERILTSDTRFHTYSLAVQALRHAQTTLFHGPAPALELARLARSIASQVPPRFCGGRAALADLEAYTVAMEGNAMRVSGDYQGALRLFAAARHIQKDGGVDLDYMAKIDRLEASLRRNVRQFHAALRLLDQAAKGFRELKEDDELARTFINRANVCSVRRDFGQAEVLLATACRLAKQPALQYVTKHNLIDILAHSGRPREAACLFKETEDLYQKHPDPLTTLRRIWLEGIIVRELRKDLEKAGELLAEAAASLEEHGYGMDAHLARIDLAMALKAKAR